MNATPLNMPKVRPVRTWTPPIEKQGTESAPMPVTSPKADNARSKRARRNGWSS